MNMNDINIAANHIIAAYDLTPNSARTTIDDAIAAYCDDPSIDRTTMMRIRTRIELTFDIA